MTHSFSLCFEYDGTYLLLSFLKEGDKGCYVLHAHICLSNGHVTVAVYLLLLYTELNGQLGRDSSNLGGFRMKV